MKRFTIEAGAHLDASGVVKFRYVCKRCPLRGDWLASLTAADTDGEKHLREYHGAGRAEA